MTLIEEIKARVSITDVMHKLMLTQERNGKVKSIYKDERTASMMIYPTENRYHCFSTGNGGDQIQLYQDFYNIDTPTAVKELASIFGIVVNNNNVDRERAIAPQEKTIWDNVPKALIACLSAPELEIFKSEFAKIYPNKEALVEMSEAFNLAFAQNLNTIIKPVKKKRLEVNKKIFREFYLYSINLDASDKPMYNYLVGERKLTERKLVAFKLFFVSDYNKINNHLKKAFNIADLQRSGLYGKRCASCNKKLYISDQVCSCGSSEIKSNLIFFNHRLIIPYLHNGQIVYMRGRYFDKDNNTKLPEGQSKYIGLGNDALNLNFTKRFFNSDILKKMLPGEHLLIVEGELDTIAGEVIGKNTIGIPGAQNIPDNEIFKKLLNYKITVCGDNDEAGGGMVDKIKDILLGLNKGFTIKRITYKDLNDLLAA